MLLDLACERCKKISDQYDTMIIIPSTNKLSDIYAEKIIQNIRCKTLFQHPLFIKPTVEEAEASLNYEKAKSYFDSANPYRVNDSEFINICKIFDKGLNKMRQRSRFFEMKYFKPECRPYVPYFFNLGTFLKIEEKINPITKYIKYSHHITNKRVLLFDDNIVTGTSIEIYSNELCSLFSPKLLTTLTIFSKIL